MELVEGISPAVDRRRKKYASIHDKVHDYILARPQKRLLQNQSCHYVRQNACRLPGVLIDTEFQRFPTATNSQLVPASVAACKIIFYTLKDKRKITWNCLTTLARWRSIPRGDGCACLFFQTLLQCPHSPPLSRRGNASLRT